MEGGDEPVKKRPRQYKPYVTDPLIPKPKSTLHSQKHSQNKDADVVSNCL